MKRCGYVAAVIAAILLSIGAAAQERVAVPSFTPPMPLAFFHHAGARVMVIGDLYLPKGAAGPLPAMVVMHGAGGMIGASGQQMRDWATVLQGWGVAALVIDGFGPRGVSETYSDDDRLPLWDDFADGLEALKFLAADPRFDRSRIGIIGFSRGARVATDTALETIRKSVFRDGTKFAVHIAFYASGNSQFRDRATDGSPMLWLHGEADNYVPVRPAQEYADWFRSMGNPVTFVAYPGACHNFDAVGGFVGYSGAVQNAGHCDIVFDLPTGTILRMDHKPNPPNDAAGVRAYRQSCMTRGANMGEDRTARAAAIAQVHAFLMQHFHIAG